VPILAIEEHPGASFGTAGSLHWFRYGDTIGSPTDHTVTFSSDLNVMDANGVAVTYQGRVYLTGQLTDNVVFDEHFRLYRMGLQPPDVKVTLASGGGVGPAGTHIGYISFWDDLAKEASPLSVASAAFSNAGVNQITWTGIPTTSLDDRVTHVDFWRSVDGGAIRFVTRRDLGVTTVTEAIATLALGEVAPDSFERFPKNRVCAIYHDRLFLAGDEAAPDTLYASELFFPERWGALSFKTRNGEPIVALVNVRDQLLVLCPDSSYVLTGYVEEDFSFTLSEPGLGALSQRHIATAYDNAIIPNGKSIYMYNGAWHDIMQYGHEEWRANYRLSCDVWANGFGIYDPVRNVYKWGIYLTADLLADDLYDAVQAISAARTHYWVCDITKLLPEVGGSFQQPDWTFDIRAREDSTAIVVTAPDGSCADVFTGSCDGHIRVENPDAADDDNDDYHKRMVVRTGALNMGDPGGDIEEGKTFTRGWSHMESEGYAWDCLWMGGDEQAWGLQGLLAGLTSGVGSSPEGANVRYFWKDSVAASQLLNVNNPNGFQYDYTPKTVHAHVPEKVTGRSLTYLVTSSAPLNVKWRGFGGKYGPGPATRPPNNEDDGGS